MRLVVTYGNCHRSLFQTVVGGAVAAVAAFESRERGLGLASAAAAAAAALYGNKRRNMWSVTEYNGTWDSGTEKSPPPLFDLT